VRKKAGWRGRNTGQRPTTKGQRGLCACCSDEIGEVVSEPPLLVPPEGSDTNSRRRQKARLPLPGDSDTFMVNGRWRIACEMKWKREGDQVRILSSLIRCFIESISVRKNDVFKADIRASRDSSFAKRRADFVVKYRGRARNSHFAGFSTSTSQTSFRPGELSLGFLWSSGESARIANCQGQWLRSKRRSRLVLKN